MGSEQTTAMKLGEIKSGQVTRTDHDGTPIYGIDPIGYLDATADTKKIEPYVYTKDR